MYREMFRVYQVFKLPNNTLKYKQRNSRVLRRYSLDKVLVWGKRIANFFKVSGKISFQDRI